MKFCTSGIVCLTLAGCLTCGIALARPKRPAPIPVVGWHDEMNDITAWQPLPAENEPDVLTVHTGAMTLRLPHVPDGHPYPYQWGGVTRRATVELKQSPVLVAYVSAVKDGSYAHLDMEERDFAGKPVRTLRTPTLQGKGLIVLDVGQSWGTETRRIHLRAIVGGALTGAECEYAWVRFVRREDVAKLQASVGR